ncbi:MAG: transposase [Planctomycetes bacterium]|nr:transposase [Planctomycetota bacterium]
MSCVPFFSAFSLLFLCFFSAFSLRHDYNARRPHSSLGYLTPSDFASQWPASAQSAAIPSLQPATTATQSQPLTQPVLS